MDIHLIHIKLGVVPFLRRKKSRRTFLRECRLIWSVDLLSETFFNYIDFRRQLEAFVVEGDLFLLILLVLLFLVLPLLSIFEVMQTNGFLHLLLRPLLQKQLLSLCL